MSKPQEQIFAEYRKRKSRLNLFFLTFLPFVLGLIALLGSSWGQNRLGVSVTALIIVVIAGAIISNMIWTCPACSKLLRKNWRPKFCPQCGVQLEPEKEPTGTPTTESTLSSEAAPSASPDER